MKPDDTIVLGYPSSIVHYIKLMKPELTMLSVLTAVGSAYLALGGSSHYIALIHVFVGTTLVGGAAGVLNQYIEYKYDALMKRTYHRPLPAGYIQPKIAFMFGWTLAIIGIMYLYITSNITASALAFLTLVIYLFVYTPLKKQTPFATVIGGIPGAIPPLIGWAAVRGGISMEAWSLFFILFFWQMPHFLSLAWLYRTDYARAGYKLLVVIDKTGDMTSRQILVYCCALVPASLMPTLIGFTGYIYFIGALIVSLTFLITGITFFRERSVRAARRMFYFSLFVISLLFLLLILA